MASGWSLSPEEFERRLHDVGALGSCRACGGPGADQIDPSPYEISSTQAGGAVLIYVAICPTCGHVHIFTPSVLASWEEAE
jgi:hypothetical protein